MLQNNNDHHNTLFILLKLILHLSYDFQEWSQMIIVIYVSDNTMGMGTKQHTNDDLTTLNFVSHITTPVASCFIFFTCRIDIQFKQFTHLHHHCYQSTHFGIGHAGFTSCYSLLSCVLVTNIYTYIITDGSNLQ